MRTPGVIAALMLTVQATLPTTLAGQGMVLVPRNEYEDIPVVSAPLQFGALPGRMDLSEFLPTPRSQGDQGSCVAWAVAYGLKAYQESAELGRRPTRPEHEFSPAYVYNQIVASSRSSYDCPGISIPAALELLKNQGAATMADFPYDASSCRRLPTNRVHARARRHRIADWGRVGLDQASIKGHLNDGRPVVIAMCGGDDFEDHGSGVFRGDSQRVVRYDSYNYPYCAIYGHAMLVAGYDDDLGAYKVLNSWGDDWGEQGYGWISYRAFERQVYSAYVAHDLPTWTPEEREAELAKETDATEARVAEAEARAAAAEARADSVAEWAEDLEERIRTIEAEYQEQLRIDSAAAAHALAAARDDRPDEPTYDEHVRVGAPRLMADRTSWILLNVREDGFVSSLGAEDVRGYLHERPCDARVRLGFADREDLSGNPVYFGLRHLRDRRSSHVTYADDNARGSNFRFEVAGGKCYVMVAEGYDDDETGPYTLRFAGRMNYKYATHGLGGWSAWSSWFRNR